MTDAREHERRLVRELASLRKARRAPARAARAVSVKADRRRVRVNGFLAYLRRQPCAVEGHALDCQGPIQAAHIRSHLPGELPTGMQRKPDDRRATPLCALHHREQHSMNEIRFWLNYGLDPFEIAERLYAAYQAESGASVAAYKGKG